MNEGFSSYIKGKSVTLLGLGISNAPLVPLLFEWGCESVCVRDKKSKEEVLARFPFIADTPAALVCGDAYLSGIDTDVVIKAPGIRFDLPELVWARERGCEITSETELFFRFCPAYKIAVSGSDGKSTTTTLIYEMLKAEGKKRVFLGGNIGDPLLHRIHDVEKDDIVVAELSSFQLHTMTQSPNVAVITNISPNHLDWHTDMDEYVAAKGSLLRYQQKNDISVLNAGNEASCAYAPLCKGKRLAFSSKGRVENGAYLENGVLYFAENGVSRPVIKSEDIKLPGSHNRENYLAAICAVRHLVSDKTILRVARSFGGVAHRLQLVGQKGEVRFYNSSIDSSPTRTAAALSSFDCGKEIVIICGGRDKKVPFTSLALPFAKKTKAVVLTGEAADKIFSDVSASPEYAEGQINMIKEPDFEKAVRLAASLAQGTDKVLLSPACTSFDRFQNFEERGRYFESIVKDIIKE